MRTANLNRLTLDAVLVEKSPLRTNITGMPIIEVVLQHQSEQTEAGSPRQVQFDIAAVAMADVAAAVAQCTVGQRYQVQGFLNRKSLKSVKLRLHITHISPASH